MDGEGTNIAPGEEQGPNNVGVCGEGNAGNGELEQGGVVLAEAGVIATKGRGEELFN